MELREHGITVTDEMVAEARQGCAFAKLAALRGQSPREATA